MPISREEFERGEHEIGFLPLDFLRSSPGYAYTSQEVFEGLVETRGDLIQKEVEETLTALARQDKIEQKTIRGVLYYSYHKSRLGFRV